MILMNTLDTFGSAYQRYKPDIIRSIFFKEVNGMSSGSSGSQHGIHHQGVGPFQSAWEVVIVVNRLVCFFIPVHSNMANLGIRHKADDAIHEAQTGP